MEKQMCSKCKNEYPSTLEHFGKHKVRGLDTYCKTCRRETTKANYYANKEAWNATTRRNKKLQRERINEIKDSLSCLKCGESRNHLLDFHHTDPNQKDFQISQGEQYGWKRIKQEIDKCIVLCSNCHRDFHYQEKEKGITLKKYLESQK
jgi:uncharacterized protein (DUF2249 family)